MLENKSVSVGNMKMVTEREDRFYSDKVTRRRRSNQRILQESKYTEKGSTKVNGANEAVKLINENRGRELNNMSKEITNCNIVLQNKEMKVEQLVQDKMMYVKDKYETDQEWNKIDYQIEPKDMEQQELIRLKQITTGDEKIVCAKTNDHKRENVLRSTQRSRCKTYDVIQAWCYISICILVMCMVLGNSTENGWGGEVW